MPEISTGLSRLITIRKIIMSPILIIHFIIGVSALIAVITIIASSNRSQIKTDGYCPSCGEKGTYTRESSYGFLTWDTDYSSMCSECGFFEENIPKPKEYKYDRLTGERTR